ncbi:exodeoxyribonuclease VII small subunit [Candidatus Merdisoma sp. JLR.KK006]|jgi:exodeoxyribonuclease VII small subunit|uniref:exodeoxyribonuclease VII small subunit n=1 Tax=Candidatus Merdisoma sp. JLR.KK006 TaxID=3112626 RepID=UPI002FEEB50A
MLQSRDERFMDMDQMENQEKTLEEAFAELDQMLEKLSDRDTALEESFQVYAEGAKLLKYCNEKLDKVEKKMLVLSEEGTLDEF